MHCKYYFSFLVVFLLFVMECHAARIAGFVKDETDENRFIYVSKELNVEYDTLFADSIEDAKHQIEDMLIDYWNDKIDYLENQIKSFQDKE